MNLPALPFSPKATVIAIGVSLFVAVNYEELLFIATDPPPADQIVSPGTAVRGKDQESPPVVRSPIDRLKDSAQAGTVKDQLLLASKYRTGDGVTKDQAEASRWYLLAAQSGDVQAMYEVSLRYRQAFGSNKNYAEADVWRQRAATKGHPNAAYEMAHTYGTVNGRGAVLSRQKEKDAGDSSRQLVTWLTMAAEAGFPPAKHELALIRLFGIAKGSADKAQYLVPLPTVIASAVELLKENANAGYWESQYALAELYQTGYADVKPSQVQSSEWWQRLDGQTDTSVQTSIGRRYFAGDAAQYRMGENKWKGKSLSYEETNQVAFDWFSRAAAQADRHALWQLAMMEYQGIGTSKNESRAMQIHQKAAELGQIDAMYHLGVAYTIGSGVAKDYPRALHWFGQSVAYEDARGNNDLRSHAQNAIASLYENGYGVPHDLTLAYAWYSLASNGGYEGSSSSLSRVAELLKPEQLLEAQNLAREWKPGAQISRRTP